MTSPYEAKLEELYDQAVAIVAAHKIHADDGLPCNNTNYCDHLRGEMDDVLDRAFPDADIAVYLSTDPKILDWTFDSSADTPRQAIADALRLDAELRLWPGEGLIPIHPSTTQPEGATQ